MTKLEKETVAHINRTSAGLRDALFDEMDALRNGSSNPTRANAVSKLASGVIETVRMEMEVQKHAAKIASHAQTSAPASPLGESIKLGA